MDLITTLRLKNQYITPSGRVQDPAHIVRHLLGVQAQDESAARWGIAQRAGCTEEAVHQAIVDRQIVRSWPMRGTLHFVPAEDLRWMLQLCGSLTLQSFVRRRGFLGISDDLAARSLHVITTALATHQIMMRAQLIATLIDAGIPATSQWGYHLLCYAATLGLICFGPRTPEGKDTFVLLDTWIKTHTDLAGDAALVELTRRYFTAHGPAQIIDLNWWSGIGKTKIARALLALHHEIEPLVHEGITYYHVPHTHVAQSAPRAPQTYLLPAYDEYILGYKDRRAIIDDADATKIDPARNGVFRPAIVHEGRIIGTWKKVTKKKAPEIETIYFMSPPARAISQVARAWDEYVAHIRYI